MISPEQAKQFWKSVSNYVDAHEDYIRSAAKGRQARYRTLRNAEGCLDLEMANAGARCIVFGRYVVRRMGTGRLDLVGVDLHLDPNRSPDMTDRRGVLYGPNSGPRS